MTNNPEETTPDSGLDSTTTESLEAEAEAEAGAGAGAVTVSDEAATFSKLVEPRSEHRLVLEAGIWHQISPKYVIVQLISSGTVLLLVIVATLLLALLWNQWWAWIPGGIITFVMVWSLAIMPRQARAIGYQLREDDLVFRRGILWQRMVAVPYGRMQLVDITHGPLDRKFGIAQLKFVTAAAATGVVIPGLSQGTAEMLRDHLVAVAESRRTGL
ncbi:PH domain-containing protein [Microbacterium sp. NPDC076911]|uniref:PH domain-containing protein n=1 Tax=Microbacterium sp. NPDC076911 TaxID=3154958 RepID=UPI00341E9789